MVAWVYIGAKNKNIQYLCLSTDTKLAGDKGSRLYETNTTTHYINIDGTATGWVEYKSPVIYTSTT